MKTKIQKSLGLVVVTVALLLFLPSTVLAAPHSQVYAVACRTGAGSVDSSGGLGCGDPKDKARITAVGSAASSQKNNSGASVVTINCGSSMLAKTYKVNDQPRSFKCVKGSPKVTQNSSTSSGGGSGGAAGGSGSAGSGSSASTCPTGTKNCVDPAIECKNNTDSCDLVKKYVNPAINLFSVAFGLIAIISLIFGSINFATSEGDPQKASRAKQRIFNTIFAVVAYMFMYSFLQFLVPGGLFNR